MNTDAPYEYFRMILLTVVGQAFEAAGYRLEERPIQWAGGKYRFRKRFDDGRITFIDFQFLGYVDSEWSGSAPSRFRVMLHRNNQPERSLSALVMDDFGVAILPSADHWWPFSNTDELGRALAEAGHLIAGYAIPWLAGELEPPSE